MATEPITGTIPIPADFPVEWDDPRDAQLMWERDRMHFPGPLTPLDYDLIRHALETGFRHAATVYEPPIEGLRGLLIKGYWYQAIVPVMGPPEVMEERGRRAEANIRAAIGRLGELWEKELLPEIEGHIAWFDAFDLEGASDAELLAHLEETWEHAGRLWQIHFELVFPSYIAISEFDEMYRELLGDGGAFQAYELTAGVPNKTIESGQALWQLSRRALESPEVRRVLEEEAAADVKGALERSDEGRRFLAELDDYLRAYGERGHEWLLSSPSWIEDPTPAIKNLKDYITRPDGDDPFVVSGDAARRRELAVASARERLAEYPEAVRGAFEGLLAGALAGTLISEDHNFHIDFRSMHRVRLVLQEAGRRLVRSGSIDERQDVFLLEYDELRETLASPVDRRPLVAERRAELEAARRLDPPLVVGSMPPGPPPDDAFSRFLTKFFGGPPPEQGDAALVRGAAGSPGAVRGRARIARSLTDAADLGAGDVLVCETTSPPWTPLFTTIAAVVTDTGGILSHSAVIAREYGIPAVVGTGNGTAVLRDGQEIEVDGDAGVVRVL